MSNYKSRPAALTGIAFLVLAAATFIIGGSPPDPAEESGAKIAAWYIDNRDQVQVSALVGVPAIVLLLFYGAYLRAVLTAAAGAGRSILPNVAFAGLIVLATGLAVDSTLSFVLSDYADDIPPASTHAIAAIFADDFIPFAVGIAAFLLATGISIVRHGGLPKWLGWAAIVFGVTAFTPVGFVGFLFGALFVGGTSILLAVRAGTSDTPEEPPAQAPPPPVPAEPAAA